MKDLQNRDHKQMTLVIEIPDNNTTQCTHIGFIINTNIRPKIPEIRNNIADQNNT